jgi:hypothetical protein
MVSPLMLISVKLMAAGLVVCVFWVLLFKIAKKLAANESNSRISIIAASVALIVTVIMSVTYIGYGVITLFGIVKDTFS